MLIEEEEKYDTDSSSEEDYGLKSMLTIPSFLVSTFQHFIQWNQKSGQRSPENAQFIIELVLLHNPLFEEAFMRGYIKLLLCWNETETDYSIVILYYYYQQDGQNFYHTINYWKPTHVYYAEIFAI